MPWWAALIVHGFWSHKCRNDNHMKIISGACKPLEHNLVMLSQNFVHFKSMNYHVNFSFFDLFPFYGKTVQVCDCRLVWSDQVLALPMAGHASRNRAFLVMMNSWHLNLRTSVHPGLSTLSHVSTMWPGSWHLPNQRPPSPLGSSTSPVSWGAIHSMDFNAGS